MKVPFWMLYAYRWVTGYLWGKKCAQCGKHFFGPEPFICPECEKVWRV